MTHGLDHESKGMMLATATTATIYIYILVIILVILVDERFFFLFKEILSVLCNVCFSQHRMRNMPDTARQTF